MDWFTILSWACIISTVSSFTAGFPDFQIILRKKTTGQTPFLPFLISLLVNAGSLAYGILQWDFTLLVVNSIGFVLNIVYVFIYSSYAVDKVKTYRQLISALSVVLTIMFYFKFVLLDRKQIVNYLGMINIVTVIAMNVSPMAELQNVLKNKSSASLSFPLALAMFSNSVLWCLYGKALSDVFIMIPSVPGIVSSILQFYFLAKYPKETEKKTN